MRNKLGYPIILGRTHPSWKTSSMGSGLDVVVNAKQRQSPRCSHDLFIPHCLIPRAKDGEVWHAVILEETIHSDLVLGVRPLPSGNSWRKWKDQSQSPLLAFPVPGLSDQGAVTMTGQLCRPNVLKNWG